MSGRINPVFIDAPEPGNILGYLRKSCQRSQRKGTASNVGHYESSAGRFGGQASKIFAFLRGISRWRVDDEQRMRVSGIKVCRCSQAIPGTILRRESVADTRCARLVVAVLPVGSPRIRETGDQGPLRRFRRSGV